MATQTENRPVSVPSTATYCGGCQHLDRSSLRFDGEAWQGCCNKRTELFIHDGGSMTVRKSVAYRDPGCSVFEADYSRDEW